VPVTSTEAATIATVKYCIATSLVSFCSQECVSFFAYRRETQEGEEEEESLGSTVYKDCIAGHISTTNIYMFDSLQL
jgi:hypothetical protein